MSSEPWWSRERTPNTTWFWHLVKKLDHTMWPHPFWTHDNYLHSHVSETCHVGCPFPGSSWLWAHLAWSQSSRRPRGGDRIFLLRPFCLEAAFWFGIIKYTYLSPCNEILLKTVSAHAPEAPKVFSFRPHSSSMEAARSKIQKSSKSPSLEVSKMVRHAFPGQKLRELWYFEVFAQIC